MAVLKHIAIKNADYSAAVCYLKYQHDERHLKPLLDENGSMMIRSEFHMNGVNCNPDTFDLECEMLNDQYRKNYRYDEVKSHHYIISFDPRDKDEHHLTGEKAQTLGLEFVKNHLPGHQALVCTHTDGHNGSGNIHVHIIINSLRKLDIEPQSYTTRSIDCKAGYKHHLTKDYLKYLQQELMNLCQRENLYQVDLLSPAQHKITEAEYWLQKRGQKELEDINEQIIADGMNPMETTFQTRKQFVRNAVSEISSSAISFEDFQSQLFEKYKINKRTIIGWERDGRYPRSIEMLEKMADIFHVPLTYLQPDQSLFIERAAEAYGKKGKIEAQHLAFELTELFASGELTPQDMDGIMYEMHKAYFKYREQKREKERIMNL